MLSYVDVFVLAAITDDNSGRTALVRWICLCRYGNLAAILSFWIFNGDPIGTTRRLPRLINGDIEVFALS